MYKLKPLIVFGLIVLFVYLFYNHPPGLNILVFEVLLICCNLYYIKVKLTPRLITLLITFITTALLFVINYTTISLLFNLVNITLVVAYLNQPLLKSLLYPFIGGLKLFPKSAGIYLSDLSQRTALRNKPSLITIAIFPILIAVFYIFIYSASSPFFNNAINKAGIIIGNIFYWEIDYLQLFLLVVIGLFAITPFFYYNNNLRIFNKDIISKDYLTRIRQKNKRIKVLGLLNEYRSGIILFSLLNLILFVVNILDITNIWFGFEWNGQYLKQFVHEGTYILIFSIILSIGLILFYFRNNLNFYSKNNFLKFLAYAWLAQNAILAISVAIRNLWYIEYFALAYKRIGVIFFLIFTLILIITVIKKINQKKSYYYLAKVNSWSFFIILFSISLFNWDNIIAKYNLSNYKTSFVHWDFLAYLPGKTLHVLDISNEKIKEIEKAQENQFNFENIYLSPEEYREIIDKRKRKFINNWEGKGILSWNLAEYIAYKNLTSNN